MATTLQTTLHNAFSWTNIVVFWLKFSCSVFLMVHYGDVIMGTMASQITILTIVYSTVYWDAAKNSSVTGLCVGKSPGTGEFPAQMACNAENISIWWRHHAKIIKPSRPHHGVTRTQWVNFEVFMGINYIGLVIRAVIEIATNGFMVEKIMPYTLSCSQVRWLFIRGTQLIARRTAGSWKSICSIPRNMCFSMNWCPCPRDRTYAMNRTCNECLWKNMI